MYPFEAYEITQWLPERGGYTPTQTPHTISHERGIQTYKQSTCPWKGGTFIIHEPKSNLVIALSNGVLGLYPQREGGSRDTANHDFGPYWKCMENEARWLGFENTVSAAYIGHNNEMSCWRFAAKQLSHGDRESFCARQHPDGGYVLLVKYGSGFVPMRAGGKGGTELVLDNGQKEGTRWQFIRVDYP
ncbi:hypothetical protein BO86DRAFT_444579 [Aspergillus japonicus CBS 114.51]|uniref:Ricin B lectin domain-containing protein n=1 Tax=Aspergillus japonicus CBS 114.51 TaxID=1448312 RepID=A0A8T8XJ82_ASPJA|nr:hypothetical protein BO86DRAFT_444579 [Aspergillus japonicus CBS 114.51]RAH87689.1 hypothetical protein BO86DRAFT_444579 [Aspergillus japonicus CBS 114.51]